MRAELLRRRKGKKLSLRLFFPRRRAPCAPETARQAPFSTTARPQASLFVRDYRASEEKEKNRFWSLLFPDAHPARSGDFRGYFFFFSLSQRDKESFLVPSEKEGSIKNNPKEKGRKDEGSSEAQVASL